MAPNTSVEGTLFHSRCAALKKSPSPLRCAPLGCVNERAYHAESKIDRAHAQRSCATGNSPSISLAELLSTAGANSRRTMVALIFTLAVVRSRGTDRCGFGAFA